MITSAFVAPELMPGWLGTIAEWNPLSSTVTATRELFGNGDAAGSWIASHAVLMAVVWPVVLSAIFFPLVRAAICGAFPLVGIRAQRWANQRPPCRSRNTTRSRPSAVTTSQ